MKTLLPLLLLISVCCFGQIKTAKVHSEMKEPKEIEYDSLSNFLGVNAHLYLGQELYLKGKPESLRKYGYEKFYLRYNEGKGQSNIYKCCDQYNSKYEELAGKNFLVLDFITTAVNEKYLQLKAKETSDTLFFKYNDEYDFYFPFVVIGYYEKLKKNLIGKKFVFGKYLKGYNEEDFNTGDKIIFNANDKWICKDIVVEEKYFNLVALFKNNRGNTIVIDPTSIIGQDKFNNVFTEKEANKYRERFGTVIWARILSGEVSIGMSKEMCRLAWGSPEKINETIYRSKKSEQWVYDDNYLYFENGKLNVIQ